MIGVDMYGFHREFEDMAREFRETGDRRVIWEAHSAGIERKYCQVEKLVNLGKTPRPTGFKIACFPIKVQGASGGWCRPMRLFDLLTSPQSSRSDLWSLRYLAPSVEQS